MINPVFSFKFLPAAAPATGQIVIVSIFLVDENNQAVNGDNIIVTYEQNLNGNITDSAVTIAGQGLVIYRGTYVAGYSWKIISQSDNPNPEPPVVQCDLEISYINVDNPESSPGAFDAQITVNATSSYLPIQYSTDNVTFQTSNVFTGLQGGVADVYVKDANPTGCTAIQPVNIPVTKNLLVADPSVTLTGGNMSRWNAAFNPIVFTYQRKDFEVTGITADSTTGNAKVTINGDMSTISTAITTNQTVISNAAAQGITVINTLNIYVYLNAGAYAGVFTVIAADNTSLTLNTPYTANATGFININMLRPYYKVFTNITYTAPLTSTSTTITSVNRPNSAGITQADISNLLQSLLQAKDGSDYTQVNYPDTNLSASYTIQYAESYDDGSATGKTSAYITIAEPYYVLYTARQIQSKNGGNLAEYVPFPASQQAKWITDFTEPAYSNNYPYDISFIYGETLAGLQLYYQITLLDINRQPISGNALTSYLLNEDSSWLLNEDESKLVIASQNLANTSITEQTGLNRLLINTGFPDGAWYFTIALFFNDTNNTPIQVTQLQTVRIDRTPDINSVYLRWIGLTGSWNYYRFIYNQEISLDVQNATIIKNFVTDWENQDGVEEVISKDAGQKMKVTAEDLSINDIKGLQSIKYSPKVQLMLSANPVKWQTVVLNTATFSEYETINGVAPFSITFNMPSLNIQTQ
jgi:hypothetical protein